MLSQEPQIRVGIIEGASQLRVSFNGTFYAEQKLLQGDYAFFVQDAAICCRSADGTRTAFGKTLVCRHDTDATFSVDDVTIGINFHWERKQRQTFQGDAHLVLRDDGTLTLINVISVEEYLCSVISSEMSAEAPLELLKAHAVTSRSWLVAMLEREERFVGVPPLRSIQKDNELIRWYDREDHAIYDVCADDHCQRYQGVSTILSDNAIKAVDQTRGLFLVSDGRICDARFSKACGGITERFASAWEDTDIPYLGSISDSAQSYPPVENEHDAEQWIRSRPDAYCNTENAAVLRQVLPAFDRETADFFRWKVVYDAEELAAIIREKSGCDFGVLRDIVPLERGPSGRIIRLRIEGSLKSQIVGKELEIRRWLSRTHLYSSAFVVEKVFGDGGTLVNIVLHGAGWGHGVGLCQIGAAVMAAKGFAAEEIVKHYFCGAELRKLY